MFSESPNNAGHPVPPLTRVERPQDIANHRVCWNARLFRLIRYVPRSCSPGRLDGTARYSRPGGRSRSDALTRDQSTVRDQIVPTFTGRSSSLKATATILTNGPEHHPPVGQSARRPRLPHGGVGRRGSPTAGLEPELSMGKRSPNTITSREGTGHRTRPLSMKILVTEHAHLQ